MSSPAVARREESVKRVNIPKDNWLGFVGDVTKFTGEVRFKSMLRIDGHFSGSVSSGWHACRYRWRTNHSSGYRSCRLER